MFCVCIPMDLIGGRRRRRARDRDNVREVHRLHRILGTECTRHVWQVRRLVDRRQWARTEVVRERSNQKHLSYTCVVRPMLGHVRQDWWEEVWGPRNTRQAECWSSVCGHYTSTRLPIYIMSMCVLCVLWFVILMIWIVPTCVLVLFSLWTFWCAFWRCW